MNGTQTTFVGMMVANEGFARTVAFVGELLAATGATSEEMVSVRVAPPTQMNEMMKR